MLLNSQGTHNPGLRNPGEIHECTGSRVRQSWHAVGFTTSWLHCQAGCVSYTKVLHVVPAVAEVQWWLLLLRVLKSHIAVYCEASSFTSLKCCVSVWCKNKTSFCDPLL